MSPNRAQLLSTGVSCLILAVAVFFGWLAKATLEGVLRPFLR
jgi:uncharacterized membrane protein